VAAINTTAGGTKDESRISNKEFIASTVLKKSRHAAKITTVRLNDTSGWPNRRLWIKVLLVRVEYCG